MNTENLTPQEKILWEKAKERADFKRHALSYALVNTFLIGIWFFTNKSHHFWPKWVLLGWGIGLLSHYLNVYQTNRFFSAEKEYKKLKETL
jgi:hypothetical protein